MDRSSHTALLIKVITDFNDFLLANHDELLKTDVVYNLSIIEGKWELLKKEYIDSRNKILFNLANSIKPHI